MVKSAPPPTTTTRKPSKVEGLKEHSNFLREPVATELLEDTTHFSEEAVQILKFHGSYQQDNRDNRAKGKEKDYQMMLRTRSPGGFIPPQLYLTLDKLADEYGNHTLRATTRQGFQLHGILKKNLKPTIAAIVKSMGSTLGACGDLNRNVMAPPAPFKNKPEYEYAWEYANNIADLLTPQTGAYYEIWLDGEKVISGEENPEVVAARQKNGTGTVFHDNVEPIYGTHYMPRKFKASVTVPGDNSIDLYTQDLTLVVITNKDGELQGFNVFAGGGLGRTHNKEETFARAADPICYVQKDDVYELVKAIVATQRDYGDRTDRRHARLKYLINDWGVEQFRSKVEEYFGKPLVPFKFLAKKFKYQDFLGWHEQGDGKLFLGISIDNGRVKDEGSFQLKTALREIVEKFNLTMHLTPHQNLIFCDIAPENKAEIEAILHRCGVVSDPNNIDSLVRYGMACPALPTCGLAITESERIIPSFLQRIRALLKKVGLPKTHFVIRMTGCPNGCARPYVAELGFVGSFTESYQVWLGGCPNQTRLARPFTERMHADDLEKFLEPLFVFFKQSRKRGESFGNFCDRVGFDALREFSESYQG
ncbi:sulfite reductase, ferredoxin dependent [Calothrix sp. UHCC 0171]|uniref:sulfite reductase, ferredoxin dependent n=1 Tax=Calothrix sp. UHCC 0171 TaxID=3110245 RepID=UPI002B205B38|nr:sulfite reductase, ferredoxin dependent [Calothrix sp. UHCC 0171]MEA5569712.1 sulfite reductase, ferredoxin dependent [Calothrix sp. UHCC 0171]